LETISKVAAALARIDQAGSGLSGVSIGSVNGDVRISDSNNRLDVTDLDAQLTSYGVTSEELSELAGILRAEPSNDTHQKTQTWLMRVTERLNGIGNAVAANVIGAVVRQQVGLP
jgi:hypothetical protein